MLSGRSDAAQLEPVVRDGVTLALHAWRAARPAAVAFYVHGTQSHAGWLFETGPALAERSITLYVLDRRGSGRSEGPRGDAASCESWVDDHAAALAVVRARHGALPLTIIGQSMGAPIAALLAARDLASHDAVLFSAPALDNLHATRPPERLEQIRANAGPELHDITTPLEAFTRDPRYLDFMRADPLRQVQMSSRFFASWIDAEAQCRELAAGVLARPSALLQPRVDRVVHADAARAMFDRLTNGRAITIQLPTEDHYLEFSTARRAWIELVATFVVGCGLA
ncbi:MAG TPA: alpha/beta fold hydrolase [Kofleriaceae bacterium]|nr:alpha/beta fold hydrolase [Kofleriaceae bacterium]